jgi:OTU domain-containing protein 6
MTSIEVRHQQEADDLESEIQHFLATAKSKNDRKRLNQQAEKIRRELYNRQQSELADPAPDPTPPAAAPAPAGAPDPAADARAAKLERNRQKRLKKAQQTAAAESKLLNAVQHAAMRGQTEAEALCAQLARLNLRMGSVLGDGHCLFRAVAACLAALGHREYAERSAFQIARERVARELRARPDTYFGFSGCEGMAQYLAHCDRVESAAEWGDDLELAAAANAFEMSFVVHENGRPPLTRGQFHTVANLALLRCYSTSGAHYNPVFPV